MADRDAEEDLEMETKKFYGNTDEYTAENLNLDELEMVSGGNDEDPVPKFPELGGDAKKRAGDLDYAIYKNNR